MWQAGWNPKVKQGESIVWRYEIPSFWGTFLLFKPIMTHLNFTLAWQVSADLLAQHAPLIPLTSRGKITIKVRSMVCVWLECGWVRTDVKVLIYLFGCSLFRLLGQGRYAHLLGQSTKETSWCQGTIIWWPRLQQIIAKVIPLRLWGPRAGARWALSWGPML